MPQSLSPPNLILSLDLSRDRLDAALRGPDDDWLIGHRAYANNWPGYERLVADLLPHLDGRDDQPQLTVAAEATSHFWRHLFYQISQDERLLPYEPQLALLNPKHVKRFRGALPEDDKCDPRDAHLINRYCQVNGVKHPYHPDERYLPLRQLTRAYCRLIHTLGAEKAFCLSVLYLLASEYDRLKPFSDTFGVASQTVLSDYPDLAALADLPLTELAATLNGFASGRLPQPERNAAVLQQVAADSYPLPASLRPTAHTVLRCTLEHIRFLEGQQKQYRQLIEAELAQLPEAAMALAFKGLGPILVGGCLAEIQDTTRFTTGQKYDRQRHRWRDRTYEDGQAGVARLAGLWWPRHSSGRFEGEERHLAHERNSYLRFWLIQTAYSLKGHQDEYAAYYQSKYNETPKHKHKRAIVLTARKAVRLVFALLHKGRMRWLEEGVSV